MNINRNTAIWLTTVAVFVSVAFAGSADGQTKKKKATPKTTTAKVRPVTPTSVPVIVSTADQYQRTNQAIITGVTETPDEPVTTNVPAPVETLDQKIDRLNKSMREINTRMKSLETSKQNEEDERRKRLMMNLDILTRAEQRSESLRKQLFEIVEKESQMRLKLETIEYEGRPDVIERQVSTTGSLRPEELREMKRKNVEAQKASVEALLLDIRSRRTNLEESVRKSDELVDKLRAVLEKDINDALEPPVKEQ